ncbi:MAG: IgGFc-binding protein [Bacteroidetes bacterium]|nr:IgGFc-binding protein [Bacteroidota bacterium]
MKKIVLILLLSFIFTGKGNAQAGTEFWFGFMENAGTVNNLHMVVFIATDRPVSGTISVPLSGYSQSFNIVADSVLEIELPVATVMHVGSEIIENKGVHLVTSDSVLLYVLNTKMSTGDGTSVLPSSLLDTSYTILSYNASGTGYPGLSQFLIVATENNTTVIFEPTDTTINGVLPFAQDTIMLNAGQSYQVQNRDGDLTGSRVKSDFPLAVLEV